nr:10661_t:CDS:2 [Entrophospora candida]
MVEARNILIIVDREFEIEDKKVKEKKIRYRVVDTVGLGNANSKEELLTKFEEEIGNYIDEGISQIFFVMDERDGKLVLDYTTIIRTKFSHFRSKEECEKNTRKLISFFNNKEEYKEINVKVLEKKKIVYLNNEEKKNERKAKIVLDISKKNLKGRLSPKGFKDLKRLSCSDNQLTILDLSDCKNLIELNCADNKLTNLNFLRYVTNLEQLNVSSCPLKGSLQSLKDLTKLKELDESKCLEKDPYNKKYYDLDKWRETDKQNKLTADVIPLESGILGISGNLSFAGHEVGAIAVVSPVVETITSYAKSNWYEELLDDYHELLGILKTIRSSELGQLNSVLKKLKEATEEFLREYDSDNNGVISVLELKENKNKKKLADDLNNENYLKEVINKKENFERQKQNLLYPLFEIMTERLNKFNVEELFTNHKENEKLLNEFVKKVQIICEIKQKLKNEELNDILSSLEDKNKKILSHLEAKFDNLTKNEIAITVEEEEKNLDEIIKVIKKLEEKVKTCYETLVAQIEQPTT